MIFSDKDIKQIKNHGLSPESVNRQIDMFITGFPTLNIVKPATSDDGVMQCSDSDCQKYINMYEDYEMGHRIVKFVPASGAATRMFKDLFDFISTNMPNRISRTTVENIEKFAFWDELEPYVPQNASDMNIVQCLVTNSGLNYGNYPKGLIEFHKYPDGSVRTPVEEHLSEGAQYAKSVDNNVNIHFTVSPEHRDGFETLINRVLAQYDSKYGMKFNVSVSEQKSSTDTIALKMDKTPFRNPDGSLLFRPAGHGALIENLNDIDADLIFIKNIDNVSVESMRADTVKYKKVLGGILIDIQKQIFKIIEYINTMENHTDIDKVHDFVTSKLGVKLDQKLSMAEYVNLLNRPLRVCGVVKNNGDQGGGPFWVRDETSGITSLQIVESSQISPESKHILADSEYFNPVDIVCGIKNFKRVKFDLREYIDENTGFISEKSKNGASLLALERPGLWNGAMAKWNTVFVAVPADTFTPVKVVTDLLLPPHQTK